MESSIDKIKPIATNIQNHRKIETERLSRNDKNLAIALTNVFYFGEHRKIWLTPNENLGASIMTKDMVGNVSSITNYGQTTIVDDGKVVYKNSKLGEILIKNSKGKHTILTKKGPQEIIIYDLSSFVPDKHNSNAYDIQIKSNGKTIFQLRSLHELQKQIEELEKTITDQHNTENELINKDLDQKSLVEELKKIKLQIEKERKKIKEVKSFIRRNAELRYQPILDPRQEEIKRSNIYNKTIVINGGPGTGKTTALIQRVKFLIDRDAMLGISDTGDDIIEDGYYPNMNDTQKKALWGSEKNWIFFTPNELLKLFLKNSMIQEGLRADNERVLIWNEHKSRLIRDYGLVNTNTQNPFLFLRNKIDQQLLPLQPLQLDNLVVSFKDFFSEYISERLNKIADLNVDNFSWKNIGHSIQNYIQRQRHATGTNELIKLYNNLQNSFSEDIKLIQLELNNLTETLAVKIISKIKQDSNQSPLVYKFIDEWIKSTETEKEEEEEEEKEIMDENEDEEVELQSNNVETFLFGKLKTLLRNIGLKHMGDTVRISKKLTELTKILAYDEHLLGTKEELLKIGELAFFNKHFARIAKGISSNIFNEIPRAYKAFRKQELRSKVNTWNFELLSYLVESEKSSNKRLHPDEQALLLLFTNSLIQQVYKALPHQYSELKHPYIEAFKIHNRPVIAVDEATDFSIIDLLAIHSFSNPVISSVTFSGDLMQRLTYQGIRNWFDLEKFINHMDVMNLQVSYRQSPTLLEIATKLYKRATNLDAEYVSFMDKDPKEPVPLYFKSDDEEEKTLWIANRILDIYRDYGNKFIPSIAIFLPLDGDVESFARDLGNIDMLADVGIRVRASKDGNILGDNNMVRVFPVDFIKGMEFEAVFFHNMHLLEHKYSTEGMIMKNLYVGLSRASFYMGITTNVNVPSFQFLEEYFDTNTKSWE